MDENKFDITIIIITKNEEKNIGGCLREVFSQDTEYSFEVIVIDSSSTDRTMDVIRTFPLVNLIVIPAKEFGHGKTRNKGAGLAKGKFLVFLNGDAIPKDNHWLQNLLDNFETDEKIAGVYSRHISKDGTYVCYILEQEKIFGQIKLIKELNEKDVDRKTMIELMRFSTVSCAIRKEIWEKFKFNEELILAEDQDWAERVLNVGYKIVYEPKSIVYHSHNYTLKEKFIYYYNSTVAFNKILNKKEFKNDTIIKLLWFPMVMLFEFISLINYCKKNKYSLLKIFKEIIITFFLRMSGILGNLLVRLKSSKKWNLKSS